MTGINLITYYAATIYETNIGLSPFISRILAACNGTEYFLASWIPVFIIEKVGRRKLMIFGAAGMSFSMVMLAAMTSIGGTGPGIVAAAFLFIFNTFFAIGEYIQLTVLCRWKNDGLLGVCPNCADSEILSA